MPNARILTLLVLLVLPLAACDDDSLEPIEGPGDIAGEVVNTEGEPLSGVTVTGSGPMDFERTTDANGLYLFSDAEPGTYTLQITGTPEGVTCPTTEKTATVTADDDAVVDWECEGSAEAA